MNSTEVPRFSTYPISGLTDFAGQDSTLHISLNPGSARARRKHVNPGNMRSHTPKPWATQHNKHMVGSPKKDPCYSPSGKQGFSPQSPSDIQLGDVVKFFRPGGRISCGVVRFIGHLPGKDDTYLGVEYEQEIGKHDGVYEDQRYFQSRPNRGVFVSFSKVALAWGEV